MTDSLRQEIAAAARTIIVKVGTRVLTSADGRLNQERVASLAEELHQLMDAGRRVALVTSGAVGAGLGQLKLARRPTSLAKLQAVAAVGQSHLIEAYDRGLRAHGRHAAQVLLTAEDLDDRTRYLNVRNTILTLFEYGAVPIINENDTVSVDELMTTFGDNDRLAAMVTNLIRAPLLVLLSDVDGLYDGDFVAQGQAVASWKRWIGFTAQPRGHLTLDDGARRAIEKQGRSLLAAGVLDAVGNFKKGDVVGLRDSSGAEFARGLINYSADDMQRIKGLKTDQIAERLGHRPYEEVIHRDNMALTGRNSE
jgi:glutamate 5-kinase